MNQPKNTMRTALAVLASACLWSTGALAQNSAQFEREFQQRTTDFLTVPTEGGKKARGPELLPSGAMGSVMTPTGFGGSGFNAFGGIGGAYPQLYTNDVDLGGSVGVCIGDPVKLFNFAVAVNIADISTFNNYSANLILSRRLFTGSSISVGGLGLFADGLKSDAAKNTYYVAFSHSVQSIPSKTPGSSRLTYTIGVGSGRFYEKSPLDRLNGRGRYGTAVFGGVSYELIRNVNINAEWTGMNLGFSTGIRPFKKPLSLGVGVTNLTDYSGDKTSMVFSLGYPLALTR